ncbi:hypothetical protein WDW37_14620, partial [Bdellovibrionota bacterium FG-1]
DMAPAPPEKKFYQVPIDHFCGDECTAAAANLKLKQAALQKLNLDQKQGYGNSPDKVLFKTPIATPTPIFQIPSGGGITPAP